MALVPAPDDPLPQLVTSADCLPCQVCCRFPERDASYRPYFRETEVRALLDSGQATVADWEALDEPDALAGSQVELAPDELEDGAGFHCRFLEESTHACTIYGQRPLDCRLYPLMLALSEDGDAVGLHLDPNCPVQERYVTRPDALETVAGGIEAQSAELAADPNLCADAVNGLNIVRALPRLSAALGLGGQHGTRRLRLTDRELLEECNQAGSDCEAPSFARGFVPLYLLRERYGVVYARCDRHLVVLALTAGAPWFPVAPLGPTLDGAIIAHAAEVFAGLGGRGALHFPAVREQDRPSLEAAGFEVRQEGVRVVADREELRRLSGHHFRAHRNLIRRAEAAGVTLRAPQPADTPAILALWRGWRARRDRGEHGTRLSIEGHASLRRALHEREALGLLSLVAEREGEVVGYSAGARLDDETLVVLFELAAADPAGVAQLLAREIAVAASDFRVLDLTDDSGLPGVAAAKARYGREVPMLGALRR